MLLWPKGQILSDSKTVVGDIPILSYDINRRKSSHSNVYSNVINSPIPIRRGEPEAAFGQHNQSFKDDTF